MTKFNPEGKETLTVKESLDPAMKITDKKDAEQYFRDLIVYYQNKNPKADITRVIEATKAALGYYAGYFDHETRERVEDLFECAHPFFGSIKENGPPTPEQVFKMGLELGKKSKTKP